MKNYLFTRLSGLGLFFLMFSSVVFSQTNPAPQQIPYHQNFDDLLHSSTDYPPGWAGWNLGNNPAGTSNFRLTPPTDDRLLVASGHAGTTTGNILNYNGKIGILNTGTLDLSLVLSINTTRHNNVVVGYQVMTIRNPYDGNNNTRVNEVILQFRVGITGNFTNVHGFEYQNNIVTNTSGTEPQNLQQRAITLPAEAGNEPVVQLRWVSRQVSGAGGRPSFAIDNISVTGQLPVELTSNAVQAPVIFPSPLGDQLNISGSEPISRVVVSNLSGQAVLMVDVNDSSLNINVSHLAKGVYVVTVQTVNGDVHNMRVIKH